MRTDSAGGSFECPGQPSGLACNLSAEAVDPMSFAEDSQTIAPPGEDSHRLCWRCRLPVDIQAPHCPHCAAPFRTPPVEEGRQTLSPVPLLVAYVVLLFVNLLQVAALRWGAVQSLDAEQLARNILAQTALLELINTILVVVVYFQTRGALPPTGSNLLRAAFSAIWGVGGLIALLVVNMAYHSWLQSMLGTTEILVPWNSDWQRSVALVALVCVQPAVIEELFFRRMVLDGLRSAMSWHAAIWISALMFTFAHLGVPLSLPYLWLLGAFLGYVRVLSGCLWLPIVLHFLHNLVVLVLERGL